MGWVRRAVVNVVGVLFGCLAIYVLVEGGSSAFLLAWDLGFKTAGGLRSGNYVRFDPELGWSNIPNAKLVDFNGPGQHVTIDPNGLRITPAREASDTITVLCSGDSFTFGVGAGDEQTWCYRLGADAPDIATLNAGEAAYGIGQMYLKARRLSDQIEWDVHVVAFIADDIRRATTGEFVGRNKPRFVLDGGALRLERETVTESSALYAWMRANKRIYANLRVLELGRRIGAKLSGAPPKPPSPDSTKELVGAIFEATAKMNAAQGRRTLFVFLPSGPGVDQTDVAWRPRVAEECQRRKLDCADLVAPFRALDETKQVAMFEPATRHYDADGNRWVAERIAELVRTSTSSAP
ncbi:MAG: hypothetical protein RIT81_45730 [Deltaproteobacteria bacterium]